ncbi:hypothetical protein ONS95_012456 [Cadophora gregata]|uniref:uncharacterized protein n=1 Tax=Cadophora gregata TaxID=51156 RepID=UPI0026DB2DA7|nr:uncharacterized protein ONS95_012456 [Cadophora gregata]KAK0118150.1 hypothetical protein ONS95_012456 [Cadophora gregata]KAK0123222.1 hypothetical protein ONS96_010222 [Cadophora gregata f. sp. sojae]
MIFVVITLCKCGDRTGAIAKVLLNPSAYEDATDNNGLAPVHVACRQGTFRFLKRLKASGGNLNLPAEALCLLPSHFAAAFGHKQCLELLLERRAKVVSRTTEGASVHALHLAIANGHEACARAICDTPEEKRYEGWSLCIVIESSGPVLQWMYLQVNEQHGFAIEDPRHTAGTAKFSCLSKPDMSPKLWVRPEMHENSKAEHDESDVEDDSDEDAEASPENDDDKESEYLTRINSNDTNVAVVAEKETFVSRTASLEPKQSGLKKAGRLMKSVFHS